MRPTRRSSPSSSVPSDEATQHHRVRVPSAFAPVIAADRERHAAASGLSSQAIDAIWSAVEALYRSGAYPAISFCLRRRGQVVLDRSLGHARGNGPQDPADGLKVAMRPDTPVCLFSASKAVTAVLIHKLAEDGGLRLEDPVSRYLPAFAAGGKGGITLSEVLSHRSGVPSIALPAEHRRVELLLDWDDVIARICRAPAPRVRPMAYHAITGGFILAEVLQRITGQSLQQYLDTHFRIPMELRHFTYGLPAAHRDEVALNYVAGTPVRFPIAQLLERALLMPAGRVVEASNREAFMDAVVPAGNLYATAHELAAFFQMLLDGGRWQGRQLLRPQTVARLIRPCGRMSFDRTLVIPMRYSEGLMLGASPVGLYGPRTARAYGHLGFMNILGWADPDRELACALLVTGKAVLGRHLLPLAQLLRTLATRCR